MLIKLKDGKEVKVEEPKWKDQIEYMKLLNEVSRNPGKIEELQKFQIKLIERLTGLERKELEELSCSEVQKINEYIVEKMTNAMGFAKFLQTQQSLQQEEKQM